MVRFEIKVYRFVFPAIAELFHLRSPLFEQRLEVPASESYGLSGVTKHTTNRTA